MPDEVRITPHHGPTLSKLGAHLRWFLEQNGVNPEAAIVTIGVNTANEQSKIVAGLLRDFDPAVMKRLDAYSHMVQIHGVPIWCYVHKPKETA